MNLESYYEYCISKKGVTESFPFDEDTLVMKVGGKMFALANLSGFENGNPSANLKCEPEKAQELRAEYALAACGFAALLVTILRGSVVQGLLLGLIKRALALGD